MAGLMQFDYYGDAKRAFGQAKEAKRADGLRGLMGDYYGAQDPRLGEVARMGGDAGGMQRDMQGQEDHKRKRVGQMATTLLSLPAHMRPAAYRQMAPEFPTLGIQGAPADYSDELEPLLQSVSTQYGGGSAESFKPMNVSPGGQVVDPRTGKVIHSNTNFAPMKPIWDSARGGWVMPIDQQQGPTQAPAPQMTNAGGPEQGGSPFVFDDTTLQSLMAVPANERATMLAAMQGGGQTFHPGPNGQPVAGPSAGFGAQPSPTGATAPMGGGFVPVVAPQVDERLEFARQAAQRAQETAARTALGNPGPGQRWNATGTALEDIPNYKPAGATKPMPPAALKLLNEERGLVRTSGNINSNIDKWVGWLDSGKLPLGPISNVVSAGKNFTGQSSEGSRNFASFKAGLEQMRNDSLRLNSGVQTDGDAQRAWKELLDNINDPGVVKQRLAEIKALNEKAIDLHQLNVETTLQNYGRDVPATAPAAGGGWAIKAIP